MLQPELTLEGLVAAGHQFHRAERLDKAVASFAAALALIDTRPPHELNDRQQIRGEIVAAQAAALTDFGRWADSEAPLRTALNDLCSDTTPRSENRRMTMALLQFELARCMFMRRDLPAVYHALEAAQTCLAGLQSEVLQARVWGLLGSARCTGNDLETGLTFLQQALGILDRPGHGAWQFERAALRTNLAGAHGQLGHHEAALRLFARAEAELESMVAAGRQLALADLARTRMNFGSTCEFAGRAHEAPRWQRAALAAYDEAIRSAAPGFDTARLRASRAAVLMNLGYTLFRLGQFDEAGVHLRNASRRYTQLVKRHPHLRLEQARTWVNQAHLAAQAGDCSKAAHLYERGLKAIDELINEGQTHIRFEQANAALGLARVEMLRGHVASSCTLFEAGASTLVELTRQGRLHHGPAWLAGWQAQLSAVLAFARSPGREAAVQALEASARTLAAAPRKGLGGSDLAPQILLQAVDSMDGWAAAAEPLGRKGLDLSDLLGQYLRYLLGEASELLADSEPAWLQRHRQALQSAVSRLRAACQAQRNASMWLADWFFHTRGLRAQRSALAQGSDPELLVLRESLAQLRGVEDELLGVSRSVEPGQDAAHQTQACFSALLPLRAPARSDALAAAWRDLHARVDASRRALVAKGLLPEMMRLDVGMATASMTQHSALLLLASCESNRMLIIVLRGGKSTDASASHVFAQLPAACEHFSAFELNRMAGRALGSGTAACRVRSAAVGSPRPANRSDFAEIADLDQFALEVYGQVWSAAVGPVLARLKEEGVHEVGLIPSDDLHLIPWGHFATQASGRTSRFEVYPSAGAWARCREPTRPPLRAPLAAAPRWAGSSWAALDSERPLPWVVVESRLSELMWLEASSSMLWLQGASPQADGVDAFLGMGHGANVDDSGNCCGLGLSGGQVLTAHDLQQIRVCERALLSACVLGCTDEFLGEPLGFLATCFDYRTVFGTGWLTEIPDAEACLASLALQYALRDGCMQPSAGPGTWSETVSRTRSTMIEGRWPSGFGHWLWHALPGTVEGLDPRWKREVAAACDPAIFDRPPRSLRRLIPWMVALGH